MNKSDYSQLQIGSYNSLVQIIKACRLLKGWATRKDISNAGGPERLTQISKKTPFLTRIGILEGDDNAKRLTATGCNLADALQSKKEADIEFYWRKIVLENEFLYTLRSAIDNRDEVSYSDLQRLVIENAKAEDNDQTRVGARAVIKILETAGLIGLTKRNSGPVYVVTEGRSAPAAKKFVSVRRIDELRAIKSNRFDLAKLIRLCEELNACDDQGWWFAVAMLGRAILDHVPPIFGHAKFIQFVSNYGGSSFKETMKHLEDSFRKIGDSYLHGPIRSTETLPERQQVDFSRELDVLLGEVVRVLQDSEKRAADGQ
jgi:hypothetical protein